MHFLHYLCKIYEKCQIAIFQRVYLFLYYLDLGQDIVRKLSHFLHRLNFHDSSFLDLPVDQCIDDIFTVFDNLRNCHVDLDLLESLNLFVDFLNSLQLLQNGTVVIKRDIL